jgi:hypothetical protein
VDDGWVQPVEVADRFAEFLEEGQRRFQAVGDGKRFEFVEEEKQIAAVDALEERGQAPRRLGASPLSSSQGGLVRRLASSSGTMPGCVWSGSGSGVLAWRIRRSNRDQSPLIDVKTESRASSARPA